MTILDDDGRVFGLVNVIDLLVVLLVGAVVIAGAAFVLDMPSAEPETRYATLDLGTQPDYIVDELAEGDTLSPPEVDDNVTISDVYVTPGGNGEARVIVRAEVAGSVVYEDDSSVFEFGNEPFRVGTALDLEGETYTVSGVVTAVDAEGDGLSTGALAVVLETELNPETASLISEGDTYDLGPHTVATVETVSTHERSDNGSRVIVGLTLETIEQGGADRFAGERVAVGAEIPFDAGDYALAGEVIHRGGVEPPGEEASRYVTLDFGALSPAAFEEIDVGESLAVNGYDDDVMITDMAATPQADGTIHVMVQAELHGVERPAGEATRFMFAGERLQTERTLALWTESSSVAAEIVSIGNAAQLGEATTVTADVKLSEIAPERAERITSGMTATVRGVTLATVHDVERTPAEVVLESDDGDIHLREHPTHKDVLVTVELSVFETETGYAYGGSSVYEGDTVYLEFGTQRIEGEITRFDG